MKPPAAADLLKGFTDYLEHQRRYSGNTCRAYHEDCRQLLHWLQAEALITPETVLADLAAITRPDWRRWMQWLADVCDKDASSIRRSLSAVRHFFRWLAVRHGVENHALCLLRSPKMPQRLPRPVSARDSIDAVVNIAMIHHSNRPEPGWIGLRDTALLGLLYGCGLRIGEALALRQQHFQPESEWLRVMGKGNKERLVPLLETVRLALLHYQQECTFEATDAASAPLFYGRYGKELKAPVFRRRLATLRGEMGLAESATPHAFRHSFATHLLAEGADLRSVQELLGHATLRSTQHYTQIDSAYLLEGYRKAFAE